MRCSAAKTTLFAALILVVCLPCQGESLKVTINAPPYSIEKSASGDLIKIEDFGGTSTRPSPSAGPAIRRTLSRLQAKTLGATTWPEP